MADNCQSTVVFALLLCLAMAGVSACAREPIPQPPIATDTAAGDTVAGEDWPQFLGPQADGTSVETGVDPARWKPMPRVLWTLPLGVSYGAPTIAGGRLFQFDRFGDMERLTCYSAKSAKELWRWESKVVYQDMFGYNNGPRCSPLVDGDHVYTYGVNGKLSCVEATTGKLVWTKDTAEDFGIVQNFFGVASNPCIHEDLLLVMVGGSTEETRGLPTESLADVKPNGSAIVAFDKLSGQEIYRVGNGLASYSSLIVKEIEGRPTGLAFLRDSLLAWDPTTGRQLFDFPWRASMLESVNAAVPIVNANQVFISEAYEVGSVLLEIEKETPKVVWKDGGPRSKCKFRAHWSTPVVIDGYLYGCSGRNGPDTDFRCVRLRDGEVQWTDRDRDRVRSSLLFVDGYLIVMGEYGRLELIRPNPEKLDVVAAVEMSLIENPNGGGPLLDYPCWSAPVLAQGRLYLRGGEPSA
jgi:outer membrane protein assembly factor BamB